MRGSVCMYKQEILRLSMDISKEVPESFCVSYAKGRVLNFHCVAK